jgi:hypothetical protein
MNGRKKRRIRKEMEEEARKNKGKRRGRKGRGEEMKYRRSRGKKEYVME